MSRLAVVAAGLAVVGLVACVDLVADEPCIGADCAMPGAGGQDARIPLPAQPLPAGCPCGAVATANQKLGRSCACAAEGVDEAAACRELTSARRLRDVLVAEGEPVVGPVYVDDVGATPWGWVIAGRSEVACGEADPCETAFVASLSEGGEPEAVRRFVTCSPGAACQLSHVALATHEVSDQEVRLVVVGSSSAEYQLRTCGGDDDCRSDLACIHGSCVPASCDGEDGVGCPPPAVVSTEEGAAVPVNATDGFIVDAVLTAPGDLRFEGWPWCYRGNDRDVPVDVSFASGGQEVVVAGEVTKGHCVARCGDTGFGCPGSNPTVVMADPLAECSLKAFTAPCEEGVNLNANQARTIAVTRYSWGGDPVCAVLVGADGAIDVDGESGELHDYVGGLAVDGEGGLWIAGARWLRAKGEVTAPPPGAETRAFAGMLVRWEPGSSSGEVTCRLIDENDGEGNFQALRDVAVHSDEEGNLDEVIVVGPTDDGSVFGDDAVSTVPATTGSGRDVFVAGMKRADFGPSAPFAWVRRYGSTLSDDVSAVAVRGDRLVLVGASSRAIFDENQVSLPSQGGRAGFAVELAWSEDDGAWGPSWLASRDTPGGNPVDFTATAWASEGGRLAIAGSTRGRVALVAPRPADVSCTSTGVLCADALGAEAEGFLAVLDPGDTDVRFSACELAEEGEGP